MMEPNERKPEAETFRFDFDAEEDRRKAFPYACRFYLDRNGELQREFFDFDRDWTGRDTVRVSGEYEVQAGDVIEELVFASWKNKYRYSYLISPDGEKLDLHGGKTEIRRYLRGKLKAEDLVYERDRDRLAGGRRLRLESERERLVKEIERLRGELENVEAELEERTTV